MLIYMISFHPRNGPMKQYYYYPIFSIKKMRLRKIMQFTQMTESGMNLETLAHVTLSSSENKFLEEHRVMHHTIHQGERGSGSISQEKQLSISPLAMVSHHLRAIILSLPAEVRKCPILKRPDKGLTQLVMYQVVCRKPEPRKGCRLPTSYSRDWKGPTSSRALHPGKMSQSLSPATLHNPSPKNSSINSYHQP